MNLNRSIHQHQPEVKATSILQCAPVDRIHPAGLVEPGPGVRQRAPEDGDGVVHAARVAVQDLLGDERPAIRLLGDARRDRPPALVRDVHVAGVPGGGRAGGQRERGDGDALVEEQQRGGCAGGEGRGGA